MERVTSRTAALVRWPHGSARQRGASPWLAAPGLVPALVARHRVLPESGRTTRQSLLSLYAHLNDHLGQIGRMRRILTAGAAVQSAQL